MTNFLHTVAQDLIIRFGNNLSDLTIVFPGKRASLFMNKYLLQCAGGRPVWAPHYITIDQLFLRRSPYTPSESIRNVCELYEVYRQEVPDAESLDRFYGWGEILISDFEDVDKQRVDVEKLFSNVSDMAEMETVDYLTDDQKRVVGQFFSEFKGDDTELKKRFRAMWNRMLSLYKGLRARLAADGLMYKGAIYREVAELIERDGLPDVKGTYAFVGFNVLDAVEQTLFDAFRDRGDSTLFYWDYDNFYAAQDSKHEAGLFMRDNLRRYPSALTVADHDNFLSGAATLRFVATSSDNAQARYLTSWVKERWASDPQMSENQRAVVLCNESLMKSVLHSIPADEPLSPTSLNVTMGFPLVDTPVYSCFMALLDLQCDGYDADARGFRATFLSRLRSHVFCPESFKTDNLSALSYAADDKVLFIWLRECMETLGKSIKDMGLTEVYSQLYTEATFQVYCAVNQFCELLECGTLQVERSTLRRLVRQALSGGSIPFHGDMENGLQLMGLLETRNLDFSDVVVLSVEEGFLPKRSADVSLIPYCLKASYGLSTVERKTAVFAYYFFRLLQRAQHVTLVYNDNSDSLNQREPSRYLRQLLADTELPVECLCLESKVKTSAPASREVPKTPEVLERMRQWFDLKKNGIYRLSPSALNSYLACPLQFYFQHVARLEQTAELGEGVDNILFGTLVHDAAELVYKFLCNSLKTKTLEASDIKEVLDNKDNPTIDAIIDLAFVADYFLAAQYDSYKCREEREAFLRVFLEAAHPHELKQRVADLYRQTPSAAFVGTVLIFRSVVRRYLAAILRWDAAHAPITFCGFEYSISTRMSLETASGPVEIRTGGRIDRLDRLRINGTDYLRIVDYKTGKKKKEPKTLDDIFRPESEVDGAHYFLQTFLYGMIMATDPQYAAYAHEKIRPCLFYIPQALHGEYSPDLAMDKVTVEQLDADTLANFRVRLEALIREIFDPQTPFRPCAEGKACKYCPFTTLCK